MDFCDSQLNPSANHKTIEMPIPIVLLVLYCVHIKIKTKQNKMCSKQIRTEYSSSRRGIEPQFFAWRAGLPTITILSRS